jgi:hypothetical protein
MQKVEGSNPFSRFQKNLQMSVRVPHGLLDLLNLRGPAEDWLRPAPAPDLKMGRFAGDLRSTELVSFCGPRRRFLVLTAGTGLPVLAQARASV